MLKINVPSTAIEKIKNISNLNKFNLNNIFDFFEAYGVTFTWTNQDFEDIFSCNTTTRDMILIVSTNYVHKHEAHLPDNPTRGCYIMLIILIPKHPIFYPHSHPQIKTVGWKLDASIVTGVL